MTLQLKNWKFIIIIFKFEKKFPKSLFYLTLLGCSNSHVSIQKKQICNTSQNSNILKIEL